MFDVKDRDPSRAAASADRRDEQLAWAEEVLVSKADLEEQHQRIAELDSQARDHDHDSERPKCLSMLSRRRDFAVRPRGRQ